MTDTKPDFRITLHPVAAAVWRNTNEKGDVFYTATFQRSYKDPKGRWQSTGSFRATDLLTLAKVADQTHTAIFKLRSADRLTGRPSDVDDDK